MAGLFREYCDTHNRRMAAELVGISTYTVWKALAGKPLDADTHHKIAVALGQDLEEYEAWRGEAEALFERTVSQLRKTGFGLDQARKIARSIFVSVAL